LETSPEDANQAGVIAPSFGVLVPLKLDMSVAT
jgi:hypothetical protein